MTKFYFVQKISVVFIEVVCLNSFSPLLLVWTSVFLGSSPELGEEQPLDQCSSNFPVNITPKEELRLSM